MTSAAPSHRPFAGVAAIAVALVLAGLAAVVGVSEADELTSLDSVRGDDLRARQGIAVVVRAPTAITAPANREALATIGANLRSGPLVDEVEPLGEPRDPRLVGVAVSLDSEASASEREDASTQLLSRVDAGPLSVQGTGEALAVAEAREITIDTLERLVLAVPLLALLLVGFLGPIRAFAGAIGVTLATAAPVALLGLIDADAIAAGVAGVVALGIGCHSAASEARYAPLAPTLAGAALAVAGAVIAAVLLQIGAAFEIGFGGLLAALLGASVPALLVRIAAPEETEEATFTLAGATRWVSAAVDRVVTSRASVLIGLGAAAVLAALGAAALGMDAIGLSVSELPAQSEVARTALLAELQFSALAIDPATVAQAADRAAELAILLPIAAAVIGVAALLVISRNPGVALAEGVTLGLVVLACVGAITIVFGSGWLSGLLDYRDRGGPHASAVIALAVTALLIGLYRRGAGAAAHRRAGAAAEPSELAGLLLSSAALAAAGLAIATLESVAVREYGVGLVFFALADLVLARVIATPVVWAFLGRDR